MGDIDEGRPQPAMQAGQFLTHVGAKLRIEVGERLVHQEGGRRTHQRPGKRHTLTLAAGKLRRLAIQQMRDL